MNKQKMAVAAIAGTFALVASACADDSENKEAVTGSDFSDRKACILQGNTGPFFDDTASGIKQGLAEAEGLEVELKNAQGNINTQNIAAQQFVDSGCDVIVPIGTATTQSVANVTQTIPIVFCAVSTPVEAELAESMESPGGNMTGTSDQLPIVPEIDAMHAIQPDAATVGIIWKNGDPAGDVLAAQATERLESLDIEVVDGPITNAADVTQAVQFLAGKVDAIFLPGDATVAAAFPGIISAANSSKVPVYGISDAVEGGSILGAQYDYVDVGKDTGLMAVEVLKGADPATTPIQVPEVGGFVFNVTKAEEYGLTIPESLLADAVETY